MALVSSLVVVGLMSGAVLVQSGTVPSLTWDPFGQDSYKSRLPNLPSYNLDPAIANNVRQGYLRSLSSTD
jgi:hypothetical protein